MNVTDNRTSGDRDTLGAMACSISGAFLGIEGIPKEWKNALENNEYIEKLANLLWHVKNEILEKLTP
jgi:ADP-ribosylglycohydrolase